MTDRIPIDALLRELRTADVPEPGERAEARFALDQAIAQERGRIERRGNRLGWRLGLAFATVTPLVLIGVLLAATLGRNSIAASLESLASGIENGDPAIGEGEAVSAEIFRWHPGPDGSQIAEHLIVVVSDEGDRTEFLVGAGEIEPRRLSPLPDPALLPLDPVQAYAYIASLVDIDAEPGNGATALDVVVALLLDPRLDAEQRAVVVRAIAEIPDIRRSGSTPGTYGYAVTHGSWETRLVLGPTGRVVEHRVVLRDAAGGLPAGATIYLARPSDAVVTVGTDTTTTMVPEVPTTLVGTVESTVPDVATTLPATDTTMATITTTTTTTTTTLLPPLDVTTTLPLP